MRTTTFLLGASLLAMACGSKARELDDDLLTESTVSLHSREMPPDEKPDGDRGAGAHMRLSEGRAGKGGARIAREEAIEAARAAGVLGAKADISSGFDGSDIYRGSFGPGGGGTGTARSATADRGRFARSVPADTAPAGVRAGEWDDNANYRDYTKWLQETPKGIARLDVSDRQFVVVRDVAGKPVPNCPVTISGTKGSVTLTSSTAGRVLVFPKAYGVGTQLTATTSCAGSQVSHALGGKIDDVTELALTTARSIPARRTLDLAFVVDTTGSMGEEIDAVKQTISSVARDLGNTDVRIGLVEYKDRGDVVTKVYPFSSNLTKFRATVDGITASGGGDMPEDMHAGLDAALEQLTWSKESVARMVVVIADAPPHLDYSGPDYADAARRAAQRGIKLYTVSASGMDTTGQIVMRQMAQLTGASNLFVLRGGAGPQSVGGGDPKSSCGGTQQQYASGNLDKLVLSKVQRELSALDSDPLKIAGVGKDESAKPCNQRIAMQ